MRSRIRTGGTLTAEETRYRESPVSVNADSTVVWTGFRTGASLSMSRGVAAQASPLSAAKASTMGQADVILGRIGVMSNFLVITGPHHFLVSNLLVV